MSGALSQDQAVAPAALRFDDVEQDLLVAFVAFGKRAMDARDRAGHGQVEWILESEPRRVNNQDRSRPVGEGTFEGVWVGVGGRAARVVVRSAVVRQRRFVRRWHWADRSMRLDPVADRDEILEGLSAHDYPWDTVQALSFALFRTFAVPSIGGLLDRTGEFTERVQQRYDDTGLLLEQVQRHGLHSAGGRRAVRRINQMHAMYDISNDDMRYVLATFVVVPARWVRDWGWRAMTPHELQATVGYYRDLGRHMAIRDIPHSYEEFERLLDDYEAAHFGFDEGARRVADSTLELMGTFAPMSWLPAWAARRFAFALMDEPLLRAFGYPQPTLAQRRAVRLGMWGRARLLRLAPGRGHPKWASDFGRFRSRADGYDIDRLGTFTTAAGCPVPHRHAEDSSPGQQT